MCLYLIYFTSHFLQNGLAFRGVSAESLTSVELSQPASLSHKSLLHFAENRFHFLFFLGTIFTEFEEDRLLDNIYEHNHLKRQSLFSIS